MRPSDFDFKPPSGVPDGLAADLARALEGAVGIGEVPAWIGREGRRSIVIERGRDALELYPIAGGAVLDEAAIVIPADALEEAVSGIDWTGAPSRDDIPWLNAWRRGKHTGVEIPVAPGEPAPAVAARIREVVG
jgi:hypothetical protein